MLSNPSPSISRPVGVTSHTTPLAIRREAGGEASVNSVWRRRSVGSKLCAKILSELCVLCERKTFTKYVSSPIGVTSHITPLAIRRGAGGEASVNSVCRRCSVGSKLCAKMLSELCVLCERKTFTKYVSSPIGVTSHITPLAIRRGAGGEASVNSVCRRCSVGSKLCAKMLSELCVLCERKTLYEVCKQPNRGNLTYYSPPYGGGAGGGASRFAGEVTVHSVRDNVFLSSKPFKKKKRPSTRSTVISE